MNGGGKRYTGMVSTGGTAVVTRVDGTLLPPRRDLACYSRQGFAWGHGGHATAQLALALLADCLGDDRACAWHHEFKWYVVARLPTDRGWTIDERYILRIVDELGNRVRSRPVPWDTGREPNPWRSCAR